MGRGGSGGGTAPLHHYLAATRSEFEKKRERKRQPLL